jgi:hypothetical protein
MNNQPVNQLRRFSGILAIPVSIFLVVIIISYILFLQSQTFLADHLRTMGKSSAAIAAMEFTAEEIALIQDESDLGRPEFISIVDRLDTLKNIIPNAAYVYLMRKTDDPMQLAFVAENDTLYTYDQLDENSDGIIQADEEAVTIGEYFDISEMPAMQKEAWEGPAIDPEVTHDQWGSWVSSYAPILDSNGNAVAILGIDIDASQFVSLSRLSFPPAMLAIIVLIGLSITVYMLYLLWNKAIEAQNRKNIEEYSASLENAVQERTQELKKIKIELENNVVKRTQELSQKIEELEKVNQLMIGREIKMKELKDEIDRLKSDNK